MEKNWIEKIEDFIIKAINKGLPVTGYKYNNAFSFDNNDDGDYAYGFTVDDNITIIIYSNGNLTLSTPTGKLERSLDLSKRDILTLDTLIISIEEYREDAAISEFDSFFDKYDEGEKKISIDDLDTEDD